MNLKKSSQLDLKGVNAGLLLLRIGISLLMLTHGIPKFINFFSGEEIHFMSFLGLSQKITLGLVIFAEVFCTIFIFMGLAIRIAVIPLIINMLVAIFIAHGADPFMRKELAVIYLLIYVFLFITGSGKYSLQQYLESLKK